MGLIKLWDKQLRDFSGIKMPKLDWPGTPWLYIYGTQGSGKTWYGRWWIDKWEGWEFTYCVSFVDFLRQAAQENQSYMTLLNTIYTYPRMVIDDLGNEPDHAFTLHYKGNTFRSTPPELFELVLHRRYEAKLWTIITSNLSPIRPIDPETGKRKRDPETGELIPSSFEERFGPKTWSRVMHLSTVYRFNGDRRIGEKFGYQLMYKPKELVSTNAKFYPPKRELISQPPTKAELKKLLKGMSKHNPYRPSIERMIFERGGKADAT